MEHYKNYFKTEQEIKDFFKDEYLKFNFISDGTIFLTTLNPILLDEEYVSFNLAFYYKGQDFFAYSKLTDWLSNFQISEVTAISEETNERVEVYFAKYIE